MSEPWKSDNMGESDEFEKLFGERDESWRGELHLMDDDQWRSPSSWEIDDEIWSEEDEDDWMVQDEGEDVWSKRDRDDEAA